MFSGPSIDRVAHPLHLLADGPALAPPTLQILWVPRMTLRQLLVGFCFVIPISASFAAARSAKAGTTGLVSCLGVRLAVGSLFAWMMWKTHPIIGKKIVGTSRSASCKRLEWYFRAFYLAELLWLVLAGYLTVCLTSSLLHNW
jgi:hypothetical protein